MSPRHAPLTGTKPLPTPALCSRGSERSAATFVKHPVAALMGKQTSPRRLALVLLPLLSTFEPLPPPPPPPPSPPPPPGAISWWL